MRVISILICLLILGISNTLPANSDTKTDKKIDLIVTHNDHEVDIHDDHNSDSHNDHEVNIHDDHDSDSNNENTEHKDKDKDNEIELSNASIKMAEIQTEAIKLKKIPILISVPGEVVPDPSLFTKISVRISCQVEKLWVNIGDTVKKGQPLVTLSSIEMVEIQGELLDSYNNWRRLKSLVKSKAVSEIKYKKTEIEFYKNFSVLISYGMTKQQVMDLLEEDNPKNISGYFVILSPQDGIIYTDNLELGKRFIGDKEEGNVLLSIIDDSSLWVIASLPGNDINQVKKGAKARINNSRNNVEGTVIQILPKLDSTTRTQKVIISISNKNDKLYPGEFVDCIIAVDRKQSAIVVPESSVFRLPDGDWAVYEEVKPNHFKQREVTLLDSVEKGVIIEGIEPGSKIVTNGAFAVHSELLKSGFSAHNH